MGSNAIRVALSGNLSIEMDEVDSAAVITILGGLEPGSISDLDHYLKQQVLNNYDDLFFDLSPITYLSSVALGFLLELHNKMKKRDGFLRIIANSKSLLDVFRITNLDTVIPIYSTFEEAVGKISAHIGPGFLCEMKLEIGSSPFFVKIVRESILMALRENYTVSKEDEMDVSICIGEAVNNAIKHGYIEKGLSGKIQVWNLFFRDRVVIAVEDFGGGFDEEKILSEAMTASEQFMAESGRGIFLINTLMDQAIHKSNVKNSSVSIFLKFLKLRDDSPLNESI